MAAETKEQREERIRKEREAEAMMFMRHSVPSDLRRPPLEPYESRSIPNPTAASITMGRDNSLLAPGRYVKPGDFRAQAVVEYKADGTLSLEIKKFSTSTFPDYAKTLLETARLHQKDPSKALVLSLEGCKYPMEQQAQMLAIYLEEAKKLTPPAQLKLDSASLAVLDYVREMHFIRKKDMVRNLGAYGVGANPTKLYDQMTANIATLEGNQVYTQLSGYGKADNYQKMSTVALADKKLPKAFHVDSLASGTDLERVTNFKEAVTNKVIENFGERADNIAKIVSHLESTLHDQQEALNSGANFDHVTSLQRQDMQNADVERGKLIQNLLSHHTEVLQRIDPYIAELKKLEVKATEAFDGAEAGSPDKDALEEKLEKITAARENAEEIKTKLEGAVGSTVNAAIEKLATDNTVVTDLRKTELAVAPAPAPIVPEPEAPTPPTAPHRPG